MEINPIKTERDYENALHRVEELWDAPKDSPAGDELEVLSGLVESYERSRYAIDLPGPIEAIKFRLEQSGKDFGSLIGVIGSRTRVYEVMRGARPLSLNMVRKLHARFGIPAEILIQPVKRSARKPRLRSPARPSTPRRARRNG